MGPQRGRGGGLFSITAFVPRPWPFRAAVSTARMAQTFRGKTPVTTTCIRRLQDPSGAPTSVNKQHP